MSLGQPVMMRSARAQIDEGSLAVWCYAGMMDSDIQWKVGAWLGTGSRECVLYDHFLAWAVTDCEVISLQA